MADEALTAEALRLAISVHGQTHEAAILATAERFYQFLATGQDKTLAERVAEALEPRDAS